MRMGAAGGLRDGIVSADAVDGNVKCVAEGLGGGHAHAQAGEGARTAAHHNGSELIEGGAGGVQELLDAGHEGFVVVAAGMEGVLPGLLRVGVDKPGDQVGGGGINRENKHVV